MDSGMNVALLSAILLFAVGVIVFLFVDNYRS